MWTLFFGEVNDSSALVYARYRGPDAPSKTSSLVLRGPVCQLARTLPAKFALSPVADQLWQTRIVDPVFWSPQLPARYQLFVDQQRHPSAELGIRRLGVRRRNLFLNGERWVLRAAKAVAGECLAESEDWGVQPFVQQCRTAQLSLVVSCDDPEFETLARQASLHGILLAVELNRVEQCDAGTLAALAAWPAVAVILLPAGVSDAQQQQLRRAAPNLIAAADLRTTPATVEPPAWAPLVLGPDNLATLEKLRRQLGENTALMAARALRCETGQAGGPPERRRLCERLQADLAPEFDLAGYVLL